MRGGRTGGSSPAGRREQAGLALLLAATLFQAVFLAPELRIGIVSPNDAVFHLAAAERLGRSLVGDDPFLDPWVSEWSLGYPVWRTYQPLGHLAAAAWLAAAAPFADAAAAFAALQYVLLVLLPASVYAGARLLGLGPLGAGMASLLVLAPSADGDPGRYGLGYGAFVWRGSGLYTQLFALHLLVLTLGFVARAVDRGKGRVRAALALAATALSHVVFGYVAFVSAALLAVVGPAGERSRRILRLAGIAAAALAAVAWFFVPAYLSLDHANQSRWEDAAKWSSYGAPFVLGELVSGRLLDFGRWPALGLLATVGAATAAASLRDALARRLLALAALWLLLFFGRETWGHLLLLAGVPAHLHLHRLQAAFELAAVLLAAFGVERSVRLARRAHPAAVAFPLAAVAAALGVIGAERAAYLRTNEAWGEATLAAWEREGEDLREAIGIVRTILDERSGRVSAGLAARWGKSFRVGDVPAYAFLTREHLDQASFLYHSMSLPSDVMVLRNEDDPAHDVVFGVRAVLAPAEKEMPEHLRLRGRAGRFAVYEASPEGYFGLVDLGAQYASPLSTAFDPNSRWLGSPLLRTGIVAALEPVGGGAPAFGRWEPFPPPAPELLAHRGQIVSETKEGETYRARLELERPCHALVKISYHPGLAAWVDGEPAPVRHVTPGFAAVPVPAGTHEVVVRYEPGPLRPILLAAGVAALALFAFATRSPALATGENAVAARLDALGAALVTPRAVTALALVGLSLLALRPLLAGRLVDGHDALEYPPRLVEFDRAVADGHLPPVWAPDLGNGYGQPLFAFAPPLLYAAAWPLRRAGLGLTDSLQLALAGIFLAGGVAVYRTGRGILGLSRPAALAGSAAWLFAPYVALDLYVRAAFAEAAAVGVAPIALLALLRAVRAPSAGRVAAGAAAAALVPLAHNGAALLLLPALALAALAASLSAPHPPRSLASAAATLAGGLGLSAFFWLPAFLEKEFVKTDLLREGFLHWSEHAIAPWQLLRSPWGFGLSVPGTGDGMSYALGAPHLLLGAAGLAWALASATARRRAIAAAFALLAAGGAFLATTAAGLVWERVPTLQFLAYPWRALMLPALFLPFLAALACERLGLRGSVIAIAVLVAAGLPRTEPKGYLVFDDEYYAPRSIAEKGLNTTTREEYEPRRVAHRPAYRSEPLVGLDAPLSVRETSSLAHRRELEVESAGPTRVEASLFHYPGWTVLVDGLEVPSSPAPGRGTLLFEVPAGRRRVTLELRPTPARRAGLLATLATALALLGLAVAGRLWHTKGDQPPLR